jgi:acyl-coenzyme A synthetase/AMP-(fatty) acid ligase
MSIPGYQSVYQRSIREPEEFWAEQAEQLDWFVSPSKALSKEGPVYRWFKGGKLNTSYLALDKHVKEGRGGQIAVVYDSPVSGKKEKISYSELLHKVEKLAGGLLECGVEKGDRVIIYLPMVPEAIVSMLACARIGAIHSVVFGGFAAHELSIRINDAKPKVLITANYGIEIEKIIPYKPIVDKGIEESEFPPEKVIVVNRGDALSIDLSPRDIDYHQLVEGAEPASYVALDASDPLYILYTSGTTGKPKGIVRENGGHAVALKYSMDYIYNCKAGEVFWAASDVGWVVGHSYIVYAPLIQGCTTVLFEGKPIKTPNASTFWRVISEYGVNVMFTAPTAFRAIRKEDPTGEWYKSFDMSSLRAQFVAGERCDATTLKWLQDLLKVPVVDHWWQTESGWPMLANLLGVEEFPVKPGSATHPVSGYDIRILREDGTEAAANEEGYVVVKLPLPPGCFPELYNDRERYINGYLKKFEGYYFSGDGGYRDQDNYYFITGRVDDIINVAGHRLSTAEMEEIVASHPAVAECAVIGMHCELKGQKPVALVVLKQGEVIDPEKMERELVQMVRSEIGAVASMKTVLIAERLPKTRSGKTLRKTLRMIADGESVSIPSTIDDPMVLDEIMALFESHQHKL